MLEFFHSLGLPEVASAHGYRLDSMMIWVHWLMAILFVGWGAFFLYTLFRFRAGRNPKADYKGVTSHTSSYLEAGVAAFEVILIIFFAMPLWIERVADFPAKKGATVVRVIAQQFAWNMHYPGPDGEFGATKAELVNEENPVGLDRSDTKGADDFVSINQLHLPVNKPALIFLSSLDVIHSFGVPEMRVKQDAIPGHEIPLWFTPTVTTAEMKETKQAAGKTQFDTYQIACAQLCGHGHYRMRGYLTVESEEEYQSWVSSQKAAVGSEEEW